MSELHKFVFEGLPVRGMLVRLTDVWQEILRRRANNLQSGAYPAPVRHLLGEMTAAAALMQSNIKFNGALVLQILGDGPVKLAVVEVQSDLSLRATATLRGEVADGAGLTQMLNQNNAARCAITLDPKDKLPGQQPYQGVVPLFDDQRRPLERLSDVLAHYMLQSEQLDTMLVLAANDELAAGLLIQRLPVQGLGNLSAKASAADEDEIGRNEDYRRIAMLVETLQSQELLTLDVDTLLRRLFWQEDVRRFDPLVPRFACSCHRERVSQMIRSLGAEEAASIVAEQGQIEVGCEFCGQQYRYDAVDAAQLFVDGPQLGGHTPGPSVLH
ncbi:MAG: Hsp33 family molecular chaperone HslO [Betaproteobacteria bacterium]|nr:Hsp33 family molecular chaperone HslO [Betaproteobacteria bacterium]NBY04346.1 Hsp33 family molecular chaperone HslO [Betaproteobacteria bacterium]